MKEKRKAERKISETLVRFDGDDFSIYSKAVDLSSSGAFVATHYLLDPGTSIELHLFDASGSAASKPARVVRSSTRTDENGERTIGLGIEFIDESKTHEV